MSNISRRKFLKGAGVAALAVAAAGVLAGCSGEDIPVNPVTYEKVVVIFQNKDTGAVVDATQTIDVSKDATKVATKDVASKLPEGYMFADEGDVFVNWDKKTVTFTVYGAQTVTFRFKDEKYEKLVGKEVTCQVADYKTSFESWELANYVELPEGYVLAEQQYGNYIQTEDGVKVVYVWVALK